MGSDASASFEVVPAAVSDTGKFVQETASALVNGVRSADSEVQGLMSTWRGQAATAYGEGWEEVRKGALEVLDSLQTMADLMGVTATSFADLDAERAAKTAQVTSSLNL